jgi:hypothetical protein
MRKVWIYIAIAFAVVAAYYLSTQREGLATNELEKRYSDFRAKLKSAKLLPLPGHDVNATPMRCTKKGDCGIPRIDGSTLDCYFDMNLYGQDLQTAARSGNAAPNSKEMFDNIFKFLTSRKSGYGRCYSDKPVRVPSKCPRWKPDACSEEQKECPFGSTPEKDGSLCNYY